MTKIESENQFLTSIKGRNSVLICQNVPLCNTRTLLPNINSHSKFEENWLKNAPSRVKMMRWQTDGGTDGQTLVNARGARSLNIFPCFAVDFLETKPETEIMVNDYNYNADHYRNWILSSPIVVYLLKTQFQLNQRFDTVREFDWIAVPFSVLEVTADQSFRFHFQNVDC